MPKSNEKKWSKRSWHTLDYFTGSALSSSEVVELKKILIEDPTDLNAHLLLLGYFGFSMNEDKSLNNAKSYTYHLIWMIDNQPQNQNLRFSFLPEGSFGFEKVKKQWEMAIKKNAENVEVLANAAHFYKVSSIKKAEKLWKRIQSLDPENPRWYRELSHFYMGLALNPNSNLDLTNAKKAIEQYELAFEYNQKYPEKFPLEDTLAIDINKIIDLANDFGLSVPAGFALNR